MINNIFNFFVPKNNTYFELLSQLADSIVITSGLTLDCIQAKTREDIVKYSKKIREQKHSGTLLQGKIIRELHNTFVTPFDREDIHDLALNMKDTIDYIASCAKRIMMYSPRKMPDDAGILALLVKDAGTTIKDAVVHLPDLKKDPLIISKLCKKLEEIENKTDDVYENFLINLFKNEKDAIEIIKLKDILYELEHAADAAEHVGKVLGTIVVKYA